MQFTYDKYEDGLRTIKAGENYQYNIVLDRSTSLWHVETSSGSVPQKLSGIYTSAGEAQKAIRNYMDIPKKAK